MSGNNGDGVSKNIQDLRESDSYREMIARAAGVTDDKIEQESIPEEDILTHSKIEDYIRWRAMGKNSREAATLVQISLIHARSIETTEDIVDRITDEKVRIIEDPSRALLEMIPEALGHLREKVHDGNLTAIQAAINFAEAINRDKRRNEIASKKAPRARVEEDDEAKRSGDKATGAAEIERIGRRLIESHQRGYDEPTESDIGDTDIEGEC